MCSLSNTEDNIPIEKVKLIVKTIVSSLPTHNDCLDEFRLAQAIDTEGFQLIEYCCSGWPTKHKIKREFNKFGKYN